MKNKANQLPGLYFRSTINESDAKHFYLKDRKGIYPNYPKSETTKLIITESIIDATTLLKISKITSQYSIIAAFGTNDLNEEIKEAIAELKQLNEINFIFDNDEAGKTAVEKYSKELNGL